MFSFINAKSYYFCIVYLDFINIYFSSFKLVFADLKTPMLNPLMLIEERRNSWKSDHSLDGNVVSFSEFDIITPSQKLLARKLTFTVTPQKSLLVTGERRCPTKFDLCMICFI